MILGSLVLRSAPNITTSQTYSTDDPGRTARNTMILKELLGTVVGDTARNLV
jgi:hypothetical protein